MPRATFFNLFSKKSLSPCELQKLQLLAEPVRFKSGQKIIAEGEVANDVYGLSKGIVRVSKSLSDGQRHVLWFALPGEFLEIPHSDCHRFSADAIGAVSASRFQRSELFGFVQANANVARLIIHLTAKQMAHSQDQVLVLGRSGAEERVVAFLVNWRKRLPQRKDWFVPLPMTRRDIAAHLGLAHETLTRTFARLEDKKIIRVVADGVELLDTKR